MYKRCLNSKIKSLGFIWKAALDIKKQTSLKRRGKEHYDSKKGEVKKKGENKLISATFNTILPQQVQVRASTWRSGGEGAGYQEKYIPSRKI